MKFPICREPSGTGYDNFQEDLLSKLDKEKPVVVYCSVGYRSERIGERMQKAGFTAVYNLYGGIFQWTNEGNKVENTHGKPTAKVHGYNKNWSQWIFKGEKVY